MKRQAEEDQSRKKAKSKEELMRLGFESFRNKENAEAKKLFEEVLEIDSQSADAHYYLCRLAWDEKYYHLSRTHVDQCLAIDPNHVRGIISLGYIHDFDGELDLAQAQFERAIALNPAIGDAHYYLAKLFQMRNELSKAKLHYAKCIEYPYNNYMTANSHYWLCRIAWDEKNYALSKTHVDQCLATDPEHCRGNVSLGYIHMFNKQYDLAKSRFERARELNPKHLDSHHYLGVLLLKENDWSGAKAKFQKCLEIDPVNAGALSNMVYVLFKLDAGEEALPFCKRMLQIEPDHVNSHIYLTQIYLRRKDFASALDQYAKYFRYHPSDNKRFLQATMIHGTNFPAEGLLQLFEDKLSASFDIMVFNNFNRFLRLRVQDRWKEIEPIIQSNRHPFAGVDAFMNWAILTKSHRANFKFQNPEILRNLQLISQTRKFCLHEILKETFCKETVDVIHAFLYFL